METEKKRSLALFIFITGVIILALFYALWGNFLNRGKISVIGNAPFEVRIFEGDTIDCATSPCEITQKRGPKTLIIYKDGYKSFLVEVNVPLWRTVDVSADLKLEPALEKVSDELTRPEQKNYQLAYDENLQLQKLVSPDAPEKALIYMPKSITLAKIFGQVADQSVLIIDKGISPFSAYRINLEERTKTLLEGFNFNLIENGTWSKSGKYFIFSVKGKSNLWLLNEENKFTDLPIQTSVNKSSWYFDDDENEDALLFISQPSEEFYTLQKYLPARNSFETIKSLSVSELSSAPEKLFVVGDGKSVYFQSGEENFRIILK